MKDIFNKINCSMIPFKDKGCHIIAGMIIGIVTLLITFNSIVIVTLVGLIAVGKELLDKYVRKTFFDIKDVAATLLGGLVVVVLIEVLKG